MNDFENYNIYIIIGVKVFKFYDDGVDYLFIDGIEYDLKGFDLVVFVMGFCNYDLLSEVIKEVVKEIYIVGDVVKVCRVLDVIKEVFEVVLNI